MTTIPKRTSAETLRGLSQQLIEMTIQDARKALGPITGEPVPAMVYEVRAQLALRVIRRALGVQAYLDELRGPVTDVLHEYDDMAENDKLDELRGGAA